MLLPCPDLQHGTELEVSRYIAVPEKWKDIGEGENAYCIDIWERPLLSSSQKWTIFFSLSWYSARYTDTSNLHIECNLHTRGAGNHKWPQQYSQTFMKCKFMNDCKEKLKVKKLNDKTNAYISKLLQIHSTLWGCVLNIPFFPVIF